jgi:hypothetical protein
MHHLGRILLIVVTSVVLSIPASTLVFARSGGDIRVNQASALETPTPSPVQAQLAGLLFHPENSTYDIQLSLTKPEQVSYVKVSIWDKTNGSLVAAYVFSNPASSNTFNFPTNQLTVGGDYELHIIAVSRLDNTPFPLVQDSLGNASTELIHEFIFSPSALSPQIQIQSVTQQANDIAVTVTTTQSGLIGGFSGWMIDEDTNTKVPNSDFTLPPLGGSTGTIGIPAGANNIPNGKYTLVVQVLGKNNQVYSSANYSGVVYTALSPQIQIQSVVQQANDIAVTVTTTQSGLISGFSGWMIDENTNTKVQNSDFTLPPLGTSTGTIVIPAGVNKIPNGKYTLVMQVLGKNNQVYSSANYSGLVYTARQPSIVQTIGTALVAAPLFLGLIIAIILALVGFFMYESIRSKSMTGTPVMQGRLGGKLSGSRRKSGVLPLSDNEPIPTRGQPPVSPAPHVPPSVHQPPSQPAPSRPPAAPWEDRAMLAGGAAEGATMLAAQAGIVRARLTVERSLSDISMQGQQISVELFPFVIGRREGNLLIQDPSLSRRHAQITFDGANGTFFITDLKSSNGTRLNGVPLAPGQAKQLTSGAVINLGPNVVVRFDLG